MQPSALPPQVPQQYLLQAMPQEGLPPQPMMQAGPPMGPPMPQPGMQMVQQPMGSVMQMAPGQPPLVLHHQVMPQLQPGSPVPMGPVPVGGGTAMGQYMQQPGAPVGMMGPMPPHMQPMPPHMMGPVPGGMVLMQHLPPGHQGGPMHVAPMPGMMGPGQPMPPGQGAPMQPGGQAPPQGQEAL